MKSEAPPPADQEASHCQGVCGAARYSCGSWSAAVRAGCSAGRVRGATWWALSVSSPYRPAQVPQVRHWLVTASVSVRSMSNRTYFKESGRPGSLVTGRSRQVAGGPSRCVCPPSAPAKFRKGAATRHTRQGPTPGLSVAGEKKSYTDAVNRRIGAVDSMLCASISPPSASAGAASGKSSTYTCLVRSVRLTSSPVT